MRILLIEENAQDYLNIRKPLDEQSGKFNIDWAPNYETALKLSKETQYGVYLVGYDAKQIHQQNFLLRLSKQKVVPVILLTRNNEPVDAALLQNSLTSFLPKEQLSWTQLERTVRYLSELNTLRKKEKNWQATFAKACQFMELVNPDGTLHEINQTALTLIGSKRETAIGSFFWDMPWTTKSQQLQKQLKLTFNQVLQGKLSKCQIELPKLGEQSVILNLSFTPITNERKKTVWILVEGQDSTEYSTLEQQLTDRTKLDQLTGLPNRYLFIEHLEQTLAQIEPKSLIAVLFVDLDRFKLINSSLGHDMGDWLLMKITERLQDLLSPDDGKNVLARSGGDEFMILLNDMQDFTEATSLAIAVNEILAESFSLDEHKILISASIGIAHRNAQEDASDLIRNADIAMYRAKAKGRSGYVVFSHEMHEQAVARLQIETYLTQAVEKNDFFLLYQPQIEIYSGQLVSGESLVRCCHPKNTLGSPLEFIPVLEDMGTIIPLGEWILHTACKQFKDWLNAGLAISRISVNLSAHQLRNKRLVKIVTESLENSELKPDCLELEFTENFLLDDIDSAIKTLGCFRDMGIRVTIDDFGMGYGSLNYLKHFPADCLKIDKSIINGITASLEDAAIAVSTIDMAHALGLTVTAEGVETAEQLDFLHDQGCDFAQGYLYTPPLENTAFFEWSKLYKTQHEKNYTRL